MNEHTEHTRAPMPETACVEQEQAELSVTLGRVLIGPMHDAISQLQFMGYKVDFWESSGWLSHDFIITGDAPALQSIKSWLDRIDADAET